MAKQGKELFDEIATIYGIAQQSIFTHREKNARIQQIAACAALLAIRLAKDYEINPIDAAPYIPCWISDITKNTDVLNQFETAPLPNDADTKARAKGIRAGGIDYTPAVIIHKVIDPLFLNDLKAKLAKIKAAPPSAVKARLLIEFQNELVSIRILDPACGAAAFLVESYVCLRELEDETLAELEKLKKELIPVEQPP